MVVPEGLRERCAQWGSLKRWERRELARSLRLLGLSYREIAELVPAPRSSIATWCRDTALPDEAVARILELQAEGRRRAAHAQVGQRRRAEALERHAAIRAAARAEVPSLITDPLWVAGVVAYWAEGAKTKNEVKIANSDANMLRVFILWSDRYLHRGRDDLTCTLHLHAGQEESTEIRYWAQQLGMARSSFRKTFIKPPGTGHRKRILYHGVATLRVRRSAESFHRVMGWIDGLVDSQGANHATGLESLSSRAGR